VSAHSPEEITSLLNAARSGDGDAHARVIELLYQDLRSLARAMTRDPSATLNPTALLHETYLKLSTAAGTQALNREHFLAIAARAMRQVLCNHARDQVAQKRGGGAANVTLDGNETVIAFEADRLLDLDRALVALEQENPLLSRVAECRLFAGMSEQETANALDLPLRTLQRHHSDARARLRKKLAEFGHK
jgi:RNA polymerase sigma factor (TIGR02999 family)